ncbi:MAG: hypothetical protein LBQ24_00560 [Candidatus Peribacteria bacterium]|nr:hypothetical protein [Candidatus Peribacteria bacterium]
MDSKYPEKLKSFMLSKYFIFFKIIFFPITAIVWLTKLLWKSENLVSPTTEETSSTEDLSNKNMLEKLSLSGYNISINIINA